MTDTNNLFQDLSDDNIVVPSDDELGMPSNDEDLNIPQVNIDENGNDSNQTNAAQNNAAQDNNSDDDDELGLEGIDVGDENENNNNNNENEEQPLNNEAANEQNEVVNNSKEIVQEVPAKPLVQEGILISSIPPKYREEEEEKNENQAQDAENGEIIEEQEAFANQTESSQKDADGQNEEEAAKEEEEEAQDNESEPLEYADDENIIYNYEQDDVVLVVFSPKKKADEKTQFTTSVQRDYSVQTSKRSKQDVKAFHERNKKSYTIKKAYRSLVDPVKNYKNPDQPPEDDESIQELNIQARPTEQVEIRTFMQGKSKRLAESRNRRKIEGPIGPRSNLTYTQATIILNKFGISGSMAEESLENLGCSKDGTISSTRLRSYLLDLTSFERRSPESVSVKYAISNMKSTPLSPRKKPQNKQ